MKCFSCLCNEDYSQVKEEEDIYTILSRPVLVTRVSDINNLVISYSMANAPERKYNYYVTIHDTCPIIAKHPFAIRALSELILDKRVTLSNISCVDSNRVYARVYINNINIQEWLIKNNYAKKRDYTMFDIPL